MLFDGLIFGNGLSLNLLNTLKGLAPKNKRYLFSFDTFYTYFVKNKLSYNEEKRIFNLYYEKKNLYYEKQFMDLREKFKEYSLIRNDNFEYWLGYDLFIDDTKLKYDRKTLKKFIPSFYNIWHEILYDYIKYINLEPNIVIFNNSILSVLCNKDKIFTTNFDRYFDLLNPKHLHGSFIKNIKERKELKYRDINPSEFYLKNIWGWNGINVKLIMHKSDEIRMLFF